MSRQGGGERRGDAGSVGGPGRRGRHAPELVDDEEHQQVTAQMERLFRAMHAVVRKIPRGRVLTYGQLAELGGLPGGARVAGAAMKRSEGLPWQRVVGKAGPRRGRIAIHDPVGASIQRQMLAAEGVPVSEAGTIDLGRYGWLEAEPARRARRTEEPAQEKRGVRAAVSRRPRRAALKERGAKAAALATPRPERPATKTDDARAPVKKRSGR